MTMPDRLARAAFERCEYLLIRDCDEPETLKRHTADWRSASVEKRDHYTAQATAILHELLTPTEGMVSALFDDDKFATKDYRSRYRNAIQAAIEGE